MSRCVSICRDDAQQIETSVDLTNSKIGATYRRIMTPLWKVEDVIKVLGGPSAAARIAKRKSPGTVCSWSTKGQIPPRLYFVIAAALEDKGFYASPALFGFLGDFKKSA
jgi:hypothetical protein